MQTHSLYRIQDILFISQLVDILLYGTLKFNLVGYWTLAEINQGLVAYGQSLNVQVGCFQSNDEGALIGELHEAGDWADGAVFNPGAYSHTSIALRGNLGDRDPGC